MDSVDRPVLASSALSCKHYGGLCVRNEKYLPKRARSTGFHATKQIATKKRVEKKEELEGANQKATTTTTTQITKSISRK